MRPVKLYSKQTVSTYTHIIYMSETRERLPFCVIHYAYDIHHCLNFLLISINLRLEN